MLGSEIFLLGMASGDRNSTEASIGNAGMNRDAGDATWMPLLADNLLIPNIRRVTQRSAARLLLCSRVSSGRQAFRWTMIC